MTITVVRSGGIAGLSRSWVVVVDEQPDSEAWRELLESIPWDRQPPLRPQPDRYVYQIRYSRRRVTLTEADLRGAWRDLVDRVLRTGTALGGRQGTQQREDED